jgi:hypothetical protein
MVFGHSIAFGFGDILRITLPLCIAMIWAHAVYEQLIAYIKSIGNRIKVLDVERNPRRAHYLLKASCYILLFLLLYLNAIGFLALSKLVFS